MCGYESDPTQHSAPAVTRPRVVVHAGNGVPYRLRTPVHGHEERRGSVALAVLGEMLTEAEAVTARPNPGMWADARVQTLREARDRIAKAEAAL